MRRVTANAPLPEGDRAGGEREQHAPAQPPAGEAAVLRAALVAVLAHLPLGVEVDQHEVGRLARPRSAAPAGRTARRRRSCARRRRPSVEHAGDHQLGVHARRTRSPGRWCPSAPARTAPPSRRARAGRGRWRCSRSCPMRSPSMSARRSASVRSGGFIFRRVSRPRTACVGQGQVVRAWPRQLTRDAALLGLPRPPAPTRRTTGAGCGCARPRSRPARVARDHRRLADAGIPAMPSSALTSPSCIAPRPLSDGSSSWRASTPPHRRWYCSALRSIPARDDRLAVVGEAERARARAARPSRSAPRRAGPRVIDGQEADGHARVARPRRRAASAGRAPSRPPGRCSASPRPRRSRRRPPRACRSRGPPCAPGRACAGARAGRRRPATGAGPRRRRPRRRRARRHVPAAASSAISPPRDEDVEGAVEPGARVEHVRAADEQRRPGAAAARTSGSCRRPARAPAGARRRARPARTS